MPSRPLTPENYYRMPWNLADNAITWLEPTTKCNMYCEGCYRENDPTGHKPLEQVIQELEVIKKLRRTDGVSIAGGEPLLYPQILELVRYVADQGWKPIIITNGTLLTPELIKDLKNAGLVGFTVHIDSHQKRPGWTGKSEVELNELRQEIGRMIREAGEGKICCAFNATIYRDTLKDIPLLTQWAQAHMDIVNTMVYILFRTARGSSFDAFVQGQPVDPSSLVYHQEHLDSYADVTAQEVVDQIREASPEYEPYAFLNSNEDPRTTKWLLSLCVGDNNKVLGYLDSKFAELVQVSNHLLHGTYLAYARPWLMTHAAAVLPLAPINRSLRKVLWKWLFKPAAWCQPLFMQSMVIIQPVDIFDDGRISMCDGCPDAMLYQGKLIWKCRLDELQKFGHFIQCVPRREQ